MQQSRHGIQVGKKPTITRRTGITKDVPLKKNSISEVSFGDDILMNGLESIKIKPLAAQPIPALVAKEPKLDASLTAIKSTTVSATPSALVAEKPQAPVQKNNGNTFIPKLTPSLSGIGKQKKTADEDATVFTPVANTPFSIQELHFAIGSFAEITLKEGKRNLNYTLSTHKALLKDNFEVAFILHNKTQEEEIQNIKVELFAHLKSALKNDFIKISTMVEEHIMDEKSAYTPKEKFDVLAQKNPGLLELRKRFEFDL